MSRGDRVALTQHCMSDVGAGSLTRRVDMKLRCIILGCCLFLVTIAASAQELATIVGTVTDSTGAAVPAVNIKVSSPAKGFTRTYVSNAAGEYTAAELPLGDYTVSAEASGFATL